VNEREERGMEGEKWSTGWEERKEVFILWGKKRQKFD